MKTASALIVCAFVALSPLQSQSLEWGSLRGDTPASQTRNVPALKFANGKYVIASSDGKILSTSDGLFWTRERTGVTSHLRALTEVDGYWISVGAEGTIITREPDADRWAARHSGSTANLRQVVAGDGVIIALDDSNLVLRSEDYGRTWQALDLDENYGGETNRDAGAVYANGTFFVATSEADYVSPDGLEWAKIILEEPREGFFDDLIYDGEQLVAFCSGEVWTSSDGITWAIRPAPFAFRNYFAGAACYADGLYIVVTDKELYTSSDLVEWTQRPFEKDGLVGSLMSVEHGDLGFMIGGQIGFYALSPDGIEWATPKGEFDEIDFVNVLFLNDTFLALGTKGTLMHSQDGVEWARAPLASFMESEGLGNDALEGASFDGQQWVVVSSAGSVFKSPDLSSWSMHEPTLDGEQTGIRSITYGFGRFYGVLGLNAAGGSSSPAILAQSQDAVVWERVEDVDQLEEARFASVSFAGGVVFFDRQVPLGPNISAPDLYTSDGETWQETPNMLSLNQSYSNERGIRGHPTIPFINGEFVSLMGEFSARWAPGRYPVFFDSSPVNAVSTTYGAGNYLSIESSGETFTSEDLKNWEWIFERGMEPEVVSAAFGANRFVLVGRSGTIMWSQAFNNAELWEPAVRYVTGWVESEWYGWLFDGTFPWVAHANHGWQYEVLLPDGSIWAWDVSLGKWTWTDPDTYPVVYIAEQQGGRWVAYASGDTPERLYWDYQQSAWVSEHQLLDRP